jgi:tRNA nucleotidyltransferase (CCA-adding enzyme)
VVINKDIRIELPKWVKYIIDTLNEFEYEAYVVGGCVRDSLLKRKPKDWDITTNAKPEDVIEIFESLGFKVIPTGIKHGTVTIIINNIGFEVTTYRIDGEYTDNRRPDKVKFTSNLKEDLSRRDFTINAMAYNDTIGLVDYFGGQRDLENKELNCVGNPEDRFQEDALRMLRAIRFASQLDFEIYRNILYAIEEKLDLLENVSKERIREEFNKIITSDSPVYGIKILMDSDIMDYICGEMNESYGLFQHNPYHCYTVYEHMLKALEVTKNDLIVRLAVFFHDIGKPRCFTLEDGVGHFYNHASESAIITEKVMRDLKYDNKTIETVGTLVKYHDYNLEPKKANIKRFINKIGKENFYNWCEVRIADVLGQNLKYVADRLEIVYEAKRLFKEIEKEKECFSIKDLAINGRDLMEIGIKQGKEIGVILNKLFEIVLDNPKINDKETLLDIVKDSL